jgi:hypothetical protein
MCIGQGKTNLETGLGKKRNHSLEYWEQLSVTEFFLHI